MKLNPSQCSRRAWIPAIAACLLMPGLLAAQEEIVITKDTDQAKRIPISVTGFSGEVATVLKFDLEIQGFKFESPENAAYILTGSNNGRVEGRLSDRFNKATLLSKAYTGGNLRAQAHALADDIVLAVTRKPGIAQTRIAFKAETGAKNAAREQVSEIFIADYDGHNAQAITSDNTIVAAPAWVPGQLKLYYTSYKLGRPSVFSHNLATGERKVVANHSGLNTSAAISPDGQRVAMIISKSGSPDVFVSDADGGGLVQLTATKEPESSPCWSPDGRTICFSSTTGGRSALYTVPASGGAAKRLSTTGVFNATEPDWSPDGKTIVFTTQRGGGVFEICTIPAGGGTATVLTTGEDPSWAANSRTVIFARRKGGTRVLSLLDVPTKEVKDIARISGSNSQPSWAR